MNKTSISQLPESFWLKKQAFLIISSIHTLTLAYCFYVFFIDPFQSPRVAHIGFEYALIIGAIICPLVYILTTPWHYITGWKLVAFTSWCLVCLTFVSYFEYLLYTNSFIMSKYY